MPKHMGVWAQTNLGGTKFLPEKFVSAITSPKKKKKGHRLFRCTFSIIFSLNLSPNVRPNNWWPFFFWRCYCSDKFFGQNIKTLTQIARKIKNCPKFYKQGGPVPPRTPHFLRLCLNKPNLLQRKLGKFATTIRMSFRQLLPATCDATFATY